MLTRRYWLRRRLLTATLVAGGLLVGGVLYRYPPTEHSFYPGCYFHTLTGWHCPGCGATRCVHALLHGEVAQAAAYNLLFLLALPFLSLLAVNVLWEFWQGEPLVHLKKPAWTIWLVAALLGGFWVLRNLPFAPFTFLAPHPL